MDENEQGDADILATKPDASPRIPTRLESSGSSLQGEHIMSSGAHSPDRRSSFEEEGRSTPLSPLSDILEHSSEPSEDESIIRRSSSEDSPSKANNGRPPLAPPALAPFGAPPVAPQVAVIMPRLPAFDAHKRMSSTGDYSFMSALTDTSFEGDRARRDQAASRNRKVSWDQNLFDSANIRAQEPAKIMQPVLKEAVTSPTSLLLSPPPPPKEDTSQVVMSGTRARANTLLSLADLKACNPLETEAETAILEILEENHREARNRADSVSILMPHVPDEGVDIFESSTSKSEKPTSPENSRLTGSRHSLESAVVASSVSGPGKGHRRHRSTMPSEGFNAEQSATLESKLFGLATTMRALHTESNELADQVDIKQNHRRLPSRDIGHPAAYMEDTPINNADVLVHNANMLLRRNPKKEESSSNLSCAPVPRHGLGQEPKPKSRWNLFGDAPGDPKRTDGDDLADVQEASGESNADESSKSNEEDEVGVATLDIEEGGHEKTETSGSVPNLGRSDSQRERKRKNVIKSTKNALRRKKLEVEKDWDLFSDFLRPKRASIIFYCRVMFLYLLTPVAGVAAILFYLAGNPLLTNNGASISWLMLFLCRQLVTFSMSKATSLLVIDFLSLRSRWTVRIFGPTISLVIVQSKGFPFLLATWSLYNFILLSGAHKLAQNWLFWQDHIDMCNENNPSGGITSSSTNYKVLGTAMAVGIIVSIKRVWVGLYLGRRTFAHYGDQLAKLIQNMILISEVAHLGRDFEKMGAQYGGAKSKGAFLDWNYDTVNSDDDNSSSRPMRARAMSKASVASEKVIDEGQRDQRTGGLTASQKIKLVQLLDHWEEPDTASKPSNGASINAILQFRQALAFMDNSFPFSLAFGPAESREACIESAQNVYKRLMLRTPDRDSLPFDTIAVLATVKHGDLDQKRMKSLIRIFRPDREGNLSLIDFVRSCDTMYKSLRLLRASIANSGQIDHAFEVLINYAFYIILVCLILSVYGFNPLALFLSFSSVILAFAFMIGSASSKYFEGILFILVRRPYDIGDRIAITHVNSETNFHGSLTWFVQNVDLFTTTVRFSGTNEVATLANGSLATSRIINGARSPKGVVHVFLKFGVDVPYSKVQVFKKTIESFVKARPREWVALSRFRATRVEADLGFIEYALDLQHRDSWQNMADIIMSKADLSSFCLEVSKQLDMRYIPPSLPVDLTLKAKSAADHPKDTTSDQPKDTTSQAASQAFSKDSPVLSSASPDVRAIAALFA